MRLIKVKDLKTWAAESVKCALKSGYRVDVLESLLKNTKFTVLEGFPPEGMWYGRAILSLKNPEVQVYERNMGTEGIKYIKEQLTAKKVPELLINRLLAILRLIPDEPVFTLINQAGMDHELIGHLYNFFINAEHDEQAACDTQITLAKKRTGIFQLQWKIVSTLGPIILSYHKKDEYYPKK